MELNKKTEHMQVEIKPLFGFTFLKPFMLYFLNILQRFTCPVNLFTVYFQALSDSGRVTAA